MFHVDNNSGVANMPALAPAQSNTTTWFTEGDGQKGISWIGQDWLNILQAELLNILAEASIQPDKAQLNQLTLSIKAIIAANAFSRKNNLKEIADAGTKAQQLARGYLGLGALATKNSLGPGDVNALAKDQNLADLENTGTARNNLDVYSKSEGDNRYLRREQNGADIPDKGAFIDN
ncbi:TPA: phage tail protein, partial [Escherichia coli]|nr:phage tail protein [Escherichia coli]